MFDRQAIGLLLLNAITIQDQRLMHNVEPQLNLWFTLRSLPLPSKVIRISLAHYTYTYAYDIHIAHIHEFQEHVSRKTHRHKKINLHIGTHILANTYIFIQTHNEHTHTHTYTHIHP